MKRYFSILAVLSLLAFAAPVIAHEGMKMAASAAKPATIKGELVDMGCYLGHAAHGEKHISCATKCISNGMPMGLLTSDGTVYLLTLNHDNADPYNSLKRMAGITGGVTGEVMSRGGVKSIDVSAVQLASK